MRRHSDEFLDVLLAGAKRRSPSVPPPQIRLSILEELIETRAELDAVKSELAKWKPEGPCAEENRVAIDVLLEAAAALAHIRPSTLEIDERPRFAPTLYTIGGGLPKYVRTGKYLAISMEVPGWVGRAPNPGPSPKPPPCRCGLTQGHEPTCPELDR